MKGKSKEITPAKISNVWKNDLNEISKKIYSKLGLKGIVRSEFIFVDNVPHILEINSGPWNDKTEYYPATSKCTRDGFFRIFDPNFNTD
jgi:D-alanine-D-alanine ligase